MRQGNRDSLAMEIFLGLLYLLLSPIGAIVGVVRDWFCNPVEHFEAARQRVLKLFGAAELDGY